MYCYEKIFIICQVTLANIGYYIWPGPIFRKKKGIYTHGIYDIYKIFIYVCVGGLLEKNLED